MSNPARCLDRREGSEVWAVKEGALEEMGDTCGGAVLCGGEGAGNL